MARPMGRPLGKLVLAWLAGGTLVGAVLVSGTPAFACSCAPPEIERWVAEADGAFIGTWVDRSVVGGGSAAVTFRVERVLKGSFGPKAIVRTNEQSSACGLELLGSRRTGLLLRRAADRVWESDLCSMVSPEELLVIGKGHPPDPPSLRSARAGASRLWPSGSVC